MVDHSVAVSLKYSKTAKKASVLERLLTWDYCLVPQRDVQSNTFYNRLMELCQNISLDLDDLDMLKEFDALSHKVLWASFSLGRVHPLSNIFLDKRLIRNITFVGPFLHTVQYSNRNPNGYRPGAWLKVRETDLFEVAGIKVFGEVNIAPKLTLFIFIFELGDTRWLIHKVQPPSC